jgi:hypothetical protein
MLYSFSITVTSVTPVTSVETVEVKRDENRRRANGVRVFAGDLSGHNGAAADKDAGGDWPYENPKLSAVGFGYLNENAFASRLDRAINRRNGARLIEGHAVE